MICSLSHVHTLVVVAFDHNQGKLGHSTVRDELEGWRWARQRGATYYALRYRTGRQLGRWHVDTNPVTGRIVSST